MQPQLFDYNFNLYKYTDMANELKEQKESVRDRILTTAMRLFVTQGIRAVKMDDVANELQMSKRTLYETYNNKEDLLVEGVMISRQNEEESLRNFAMAGHNVLEVIVEACRLKTNFYNNTNPLFFEDALKYEKLTKKIEEGKNKNNRNFLLFMQKGVHEGYFRSDIDFALVCRLLESIGKYMMDNQLYREYPINDLFRNSIYVSIRGLCTQKGAETLDELIEKTLKG